MAAKTEIMPIKNGSLRRDGSIPRRSQLFRAKTAISSISATAASAEGRFDSGFNVASSMDIILLRLTDNVSGIQSRRYANDGR